MVMQRESRLTKFAGYACVLTAVCIICSDIYLFSTEEKTTKVRMAYRVSPITAIQRSRKNLLKSVCDQIKAPANRDAWNTYIVDHSQRVVYGWIPKVMSTTLIYCMVYYKPAFWTYYPNLTTTAKDVLLFFEKETRYWNHPSPHQHGLALERFGLTVPNMTDKERLMNDYFVFTIVRDPFLRLASSFYNMERAGYGKKGNIWTVVVANIKKFNLSTNSSKPIAFNEFLDYIIAHPGLVQGSDHWRTYEEELDPCHVRYDYIGKLETIQTDLPFIMENINKENSSFLLKIVSNQNKKTNVDCLYKSIPQRTIDKIVEMYRNDFLVFGYDLDRYSNISSLKCD